MRNEKKSEKKSEKQDAEVGGEDQIEIMPQTHLTLTRSGGGLCATTAICGSKTRLRLDALLRTLHFPFNANTFGVVATA